ncbi:MAG TPA: transcriptional regulator [Opitutae bacterium]|nr:transcriptional regulator [Puniceicoccaceae bacterium]HBR94248.1 transcriptional regulator [Opitutae bacterium]|tara:strand:- start:352 stop:678 length:327 start_codon:yes stop_codon:yes gene_type:complete
MKEIKAYIKAFKRETVTRALHEIDGLDGASYSKVLGFGRGKENSSGYTPNYDITSASKHVKVEVVCEDALEADVVEAIHHAAHTGLRADGRIFVSDVRRSIRIQEVPE